MSEAKRLSEPSLTRIKDWVRDQRFQIGPKAISDLLSHIAALESELAEAKAENERLRGILRDVANATSHDNLNLDMAPYVATKALIMDELKKHKDETQE